MRLGVLSQHGNERGPVGEQNPSELLGQRGKRVGQGCAQQLLGAGAGNKGVGMQRAEPGQSRKAP